MPLPGASEDRTIRQTASARAMVRPVSRQDGAEGYWMTHVYVRRFWVASIGPGAVAALDALVETYTALGFQPFSTVGAVRQISRLQPFCNHLQPFRLEHGFEY